MIRQYHAAINVSMTTEQFGEYIAKLEAIGSDDYPEPEEVNAAWLNHWRHSLDDQEVIFEGRYNDNAWRVGRIASILFRIIDVKITDIETRLNLTEYGSEIIYSAFGVDYLSMLSFGGDTPQYWVSHAYVLDYLSDNAEDWEEIEEL